MVAWVKQFNERLHRQSEKIANGLDQLELAFAASVQNSPSPRKRDDDTTQSSARILAIETPSAPASSVTGSPLPSARGA